MILTLDAAHRYHADGRRVISVTQVLGGCDGWPGVPPWNQIHVPPPGLGEDAWRAILDYKRQLGSAVHHATALDDLGTLDESSLDPAILPYLAAWRRYRAETGFVPTVIEHVVHHEAMSYAGTLDRIGTVRGGVALIDLKTGPAHDGWMAGPQTAAYLDAARAMGIAGLPAKVLRGSVHVDADGSYRFVAHTNREDVAVFKHALGLFSFYARRRAA